MIFDTGSKLRLGNIGRHEVFLDVIAFGIFALFILTSGGRETPLYWSVSFLVAVVIAVLLHELGHAYATEWLTGQPSTVVIGFAGGYAQSMRYPSPGRDLVISLAGPAAGLATGAAAWCASWWLVPGHAGWPPWGFAAGDSIWLWALSHFIWGSLLWSLLNLVPAYPLDGGQALRSLLLLLGVPGSRARRITRRLGVAIAAGVGLLVLYDYGGMFLLYIAAMIFFANWQEAQAEGW